MNNLRNGAKKASQPTKITQQPIAIESGPISNTCKRERARAIYYIPVARLIGQRPHDRHLVPPSTPGLHHQRFSANSINPPHPSSENIAPSRSFMACHDLSSESNHAVRVHTEMTLKLVENFLRLADEVKARTSGQSTNCFLQDVNRPVKGA